MQRHILKGSERQAVPGATLRGPANPAERLEVSIILRHHAAAGLQARVERLRRGDHSLAPMTRDEFDAAHGARPTDLAAVERFAALHKLAVVSASIGRRTVILSGSVADFETAFGVKLLDYDHPSGAYRGREGGLIVPAALKDIVVAVLGLDNRPQARAHFRRAAVAKAAAAPTAYLPTRLAALYGFPAGTGGGQTIGIIELGGGTRPADLKTYFQALGLPAPKLVSISVDHGRNHATGTADGPDGEVMLDIEVAGAIAPAATLAVYFAPNTDAGFLNAITTAIHDSVHKPSVISISWGGAETVWTGQAIEAYDQAFQDAAALGITICIASGDNGSSDGVNDGASHVNFPASSPHVLACGGTSLKSDGHTIASETVWNDGARGGASGGGVSAAFPDVPVWQSGLMAKRALGSVRLRGRGVPDVAADADPETGYQIRIDGGNTVMGGTSAVAPLWAGLIARLNATRTTPLGFINPLLYAHAGAFNDIVHGNNGAYEAAEGWDACTGLGSPIGGALAKFLASVPDHVPAPAHRLGAAAPAAFMGRGDRELPVTNRLAKIREDAFMGRGDKLPAQEPKNKKVHEDAFMGRGDTPEAGGEKAKEGAFLGHGGKPPVPHDQPGKIKDDAFIGRG